MAGMMQHWELRVSGLIDFAAREHGAQEIVSRVADGTVVRTNWAGVRNDALRMVQALRRLGLAPGDRVATLAMNHARHLVSWYGATGAGCVLHTINPRLFDDQLEFIVNHAEDRVMLYDRAFQPIIDRMKPHWPTIEHYICFDAETAAQESAFDQCLGAEDGDATWTSGDERDPCMLCYTSGTTGDPKGVLYEHRSTMLHTLAVVAPSALNLEARSVMLPVVPMFHANSWGIPFACAATGAKLVFSQVNDPAWWVGLSNAENVTHFAGVPTIWFGLLKYLDETGEKMSGVRHGFTGGAAMPRSIVERLMREGMRVVHAWGMTETSPFGTSNYEKPGWDDLSFDEQVSLRTMQGYGIYGSEVRIVDLDDPATVLPRDGTSAGALQVRGHWTVNRYLKADADATDADGWFATGDVAVMHPDGAMQLTDRTKDVIKSGGEWISSVELENAAVGHPAVAEAAAIGVPHPRWDERPLLVVVCETGQAVAAEELRAFLADKVAKWWLPDAIEFVDEIPHTGTGKISKKDLRKQFADYRLPDAAT